jgi:hypothetical protein
MLLVALMPGVWLTLKNTATIKKTQRRPDHSSLQPDAPIYAARSSAVPEATRVRCEIVCPLVGRVSPQR